MKLKLSEIRTILEALKELDKYNIQAVYELAKNIKLLTAIVNSAIEFETELLNKYVDKGLDGKPLLYKEDGQDIIKITNPQLLEEFKQDVVKLNSEEYDIQFSIIKPSKLENVRGLSAVTLLPLLDTVIKDEE